MKKSLLIAVIVVATIGSAVTLSQGARKKQVSVQMKANELKSILRKADKNLPKNTLGSGDGSI